jgi:hypothetical protein
MSKISGRRVRFRIQPEIWPNEAEKRWNYLRVRQRGVTVSYPSPEQADLAMEAILAFAQSLEGKGLARFPAERQVCAMLTDSE